MNKMENKIQMSEIKYHVLTCDECICECIVKQKYRYPKAFGMISMREECNCIKEEEE